MKVFWFSSQHGLESRKFKTSSMCCRLESSDLLSAHPTGVQAGEGWKRQFGGFRNTFLTIPVICSSKSRQRSTMPLPSCGWKPVKQLGNPRNLTEILLQAQEVQLKWSIMVREKLSAMTVWIRKLQHLQYVPNKLVFFKNLCYLVYFSGPTCCSSKISLNKSSS